MKSFKTFTYIILFFCLFSACYYNNEENLYQNYKSTSCDTTTVKYSTSIQKLLDSKCASCHDERNPTCKLNTYTNAHEYAVKENSNLYSKVADNTHKGIILTDCEKAQLKKWMQTGAN